MGQYIKANWPVLTYKRFVKPAQFFRRSLSKKLYIFLEIEIVKKSTSLYFWICEHFRIWRADCFYESVIKNRSSYLQVRKFY